MVVSFVVKSLFTKVPIQEALDVVEKQLNQDNSLEDKTNMRSTTICHLTKVCVTSTLATVL